METYTVYGKNEKKGKFKSYYVVWKLTYKDNYSVSENTV